MEHLRTTLLTLTAFVLACFLCVGCGPRMRIQPSIKPYEQQMPFMPQGTVPTSGTLGTYTSLQARATNPAPQSKKVIENGRIYYGYYCVQCHGAKGDGNGPVGQSYIPRPTDLASSRVMGMTDGELYKGMLTGSGHAPVMDQTVLPEHRWPLVAYVQSLAGRGKAGMQQP